MAGKQNYINHIALVLDASSSMLGHAEALIKVADAQIEHLARSSKDLDQETRVTVYTFADTVQCVVYDKDVLRLPSIASLYKAYGNTALIDAVMLSQSDLALTPEKYGDHSFLTFVLTDGEENRSRQYGADSLRLKLEALPAHWTVAVMVPNQVARATAQRYGFPPGNIDVWDTTSQRGLEEAVEKISQVTDMYMKARASGVRGSRKLFDLSHIDADAVKRSGLKPMQGDKYQIIPVVPKHCDQKNSKGDPVVEISDFVERSGHRYVTGSTYYQLMKSTRIQANKNVIVVEKKTNKAFSGEDARKLVGLPDVEATINPGKNKDYNVFVQSTSLNRHLVPGQQILLMLP